MKIINKTRWRTDDLRAIAYRIANDELTADQRKRTTITFGSSKGQWASGYARIGRSCVCNLPTPENFARDQEYSRLEIAMIIAHELHHVSGKQGGRSNEYWMRRSVRYGRPKDDAGKQARRELYAWILDAPLRVKESKRVPKVDLIAKREAKVAADLKRWRTKLKLAKTKVAGLQRKAKYYEKRRDIAAQSPRNE